MNTISLDAERAIDDLSWHVADFRQQAEIHLATDGWRRLVNRRPFGMAPGGCGPTLMLLIATVESFALRRLRILVEERLQSAPAFVRSSWMPERLLAAETSFSSWTGAYKEWFDVRPIESEAYSPLLGFIEARNSVVHGLGSLTPRQRRDRNRTVQKLKQAGLNISANTVSLSIEDLYRCRDVCAEFLQWLDTKTR